MSFKKIMVAAGKYTNREGVEKTNWKEVGVIGMSQNGKEFVLLDPTVNLAGFDREPGKDRLMCSVFEDRPQGQQAPQQSQYAQPTQYTGQQNNVPVEIDNGGGVPSIDIGEIPFNSIRGLVL